MSVIIRSRYNLLKKHFDSSFILSVATLFTGSSLAQGLSLVLTPVVARLFTPEHFGITALFLSLAETISAFASLCYIQAIILPEKDGEAAQLVYLATIIIAITSGGLFITVFLVGIFRPMFIWLTILGKWFYVLPLAVFLIAMLKVIETWCIRKKYFKSLAILGSTQVLTTSGSRIGMGMIFGSSAGNLITGSLLGYIALVLILLHASMKDRLVILQKSTYSEIAKIANVYKDFPCYYMPSEVLRTFSLSLPVLALGYLFSPEIVGLYAMANLLLQRPISVVTESVRRVYFQRFADMRSKGISVRPIFLKTTAAMFLAGLVLFFVLMLWGESLIRVFLGNRWGDVGRYAMILAPWLCTMLMLFPSSTTFVVFRKQALFLRIQAGVFVSNIAVFTAAYIFSLEPEEILHLFVIVNVVFNITIILMALQIISRPIHGLKMQQDTIINGIE